VKHLRQMLDIMYTNLNRQNSVAAVPAGWELL